MTCGRIVRVDGVLAIFVFATTLIVVVVVVAFHPLVSHHGDGRTTEDENILDDVLGLYPTGPYELREMHASDAFFDHYDFYDGQDSIGSGGYNTYVSRHRAMELGIARVDVDDDDNDNDNDDNMEEYYYAYMSSSPKFGGGKRESIRLEGKTRHNRGLFILDVRHMPDGCGTWPAFWLTDESRWPMNGEIDVLEGKMKTHEKRTTDPRQL